MASVKSFSPEWKRLIEEAEFKEEFLIPVTGDTEREIRNRKISLRAQLYKFLKAIQLEGARDKDSWANKYVIFAAQTGVRVVEEGVLLHPKRTGTLSVLIQNALDGMEDRQAEKKLNKEAEESMKRMEAKYAKREETGKSGKSVEEEMEHLVFAKVKLNEEGENEER